MKTQIIRLVFAGALAVCLSGCATPVKQSAVCRPEPAPVVPDEKGIQIHGDWFYRNGVPILIRGSFYEYHPVGTNPWEVHPPADVFRRQIRELKSAGFNAIRWFNVTTNALRICREEDMLVFVQFWIDQNGDFDDPGFKRANVRKIRKAVRKFRDYDDVILGYLVMNEPYVHTATSDAEVKTTLDHLVALRNTIKKEDPHARVSFVNWPPGIGLDLLDASAWDFIAYNVYNWSPVTTYDGMGYRAYLEQLKDRFAPDRPFILMEYGVSVSPTDLDGFGYGGWSEEEQADQSIWMLSRAFAAGTAGATYTHYADQIWKKGSNAEHDDHPEEWFGMYALDPNGGPEMEGRWRPVFDAHRGFYQAVVIEPAPLTAVSGMVPVRVWSACAKQMRVRAEGKPWRTMQTAGDSWWCGLIDTTALPDGMQKMQVVAEGPNKETIVREFYVVVANNAPDPYALEVKIEVSTDIKSGDPLTAKVTVRRKDGPPLAGVPVHWGLDRHWDWTIEPHTVITGPDGVAHIDAGVQYGYGMMTLSAGVDVEEGSYKRRFGDFAVIKVGM